MKKKLYTRPVSIVIPEEMFEEIAKITEQLEISISDYIRKAIQEKMANEITTTIIKQET